MKIRNNRAFCYLLYVFILALAAGCVKEVSEPPSIPSLDTVPFYKKGSYAFSTPGALAAMERAKKQKLQKEEREAKKFSEDIQQRVAESGRDEKLEMPDPWIPPRKRYPYELPLALRTFPTDYYGYPSWTGAVEGGLIRPKSSITGEEVEEEILDQNILFQINDRLMANVLFPHKIHTYWLSCKICHPAIFKPKRGANLFSMYDIWDGKYCGRCHGKVAYQPKGYRNCRRCHSVGKKTMGIQ